MKGLAQPLDSSHNTAGTGYKGGQEITYLDIALMDLMGRYGMVDTQMVGINKQSLQVGNYPQDGEEALERSGPQLELLLKLEKAKEIRSMDISRGADVFCAAFVDEGSGQSMLSLRGRSSSLGSGGRLFQSKVLRGTSEADWTWNQVLAQILYIKIYLIPLLL